MVDAYDPGPYGVTCGGSNSESTTAAIPAQSPMQDPDFVKDAFAKIARRYIMTNHVLSLGTDILWRRQVARLVADRHRRPCSTSRPAPATSPRDIAKTNPATTITGADFTAPMLEVARQWSVPGLEG